MGFLRLRIVSFYLRMSHELRKLQCRPLSPSMPETHKMPFRTLITWLDIPVLVTPVIAYLFQERAVRKRTRKIPRKPCSHVLVLLQK